jgi:quinol monooxygenase YgiN
MTTRQLTITGFMTIQPGTEQILLPQIDALVAKTRAERGCINYDFHQHNADPYRFVFYENFVDQAAFDDHFAQPHTKEWIALAEAHGARFDIQRWTMLSQPARAR